MSAKGYIPRRNPYISLNPNYTLLMEEGMREADNLRDLVPWSFFSFHAC